ncbi:MAG: GNAT family N-acetyltransferase [Planctomycetota bacterium]
MFWRISRKEFGECHGEANRAAFRRLVRRGEEPGVLAYRDGAPIGWCAVGPRESYPALERSRVLRRLDDEPVGSITCFYVARGHRGGGVAEALVRAALRFAAARGARLVEAYPTVPRKGTLPPVSSYMGTPAMFERAGFVEVARPSAAKAVLRRRVRPRR